ncbi:hypothetical protein GOC37_33040, partial [Sinorhizobium meliloti]|nr:hypothetical protein [Sinorhizobium meliloti]
AANLPAFGTEIRNPDFVKFAEAYGAKGTRVESLDELAPALEAAFEDGGVHVIHVPITYPPRTPRAEFAQGQTAEPLSDPE